MTKLENSKSAGNRGFTMVELAMVVLISLITAAFALPIVQTTVNKYRLKSATANATWSIQSTRFQALEEGYPFQVTLSGGTGGVNPSYQIASEPIGTNSFSNIGNAVPLSGAPTTINQTEVLQFKANGTVATSPASSPPYTFTVSYAGFTETVTVSNYGNVDVTP